MKKYLSIISNTTKWKCAGIVILAFIGSFLASIWPVQLGELYTSISAGKINTISKGALAVGAFGLTYLTAECISILRRILLEFVISTHESEVRQDGIEKLLKMPVAYNFGSISGEKTAQLNQGVAGLSQLIKILCNDVFSMALTAICTLIQVFMNAPPIMVAVMMVYLILTVTVSVFQIRSQNGIRENIIGQKNALDGQICQSISNLELIRSLNAESYEKKRLKPSILKISTTEKKHHRYMGSFDCLKQVCKILFQLIVLFLSVVLISMEKMSPGAVITVCLLYQQLVKPIDEVYRFMDETASSVVKAKVLAEVFGKAEDPVFAIENSPAKKESTEILLEDVVVTTPDEEKALAHYDHLSIPGDRIVALVGASGCGKTTLVRCLDRFYPYSQGTIHIFGKDLKDYSQNELAESLCYMPQSAFFFSGSIRENLVYGLNREVTDAELYDALKKACMLGELIKKAEENGNVHQGFLSLPVSEEGKNFSGGQRQRLTLARAFLRNPKLYIFDESTANLDGDNMEIVLDNLEQHARENNAGIIYISHDNKVVSRCKEVIHLHNLLNRPDIQVSAA